MNRPTPLEARAELARRNLHDFARFVHRPMTFAPFHESYYRILEDFALGKIRRLIVTLPPQHGKSLGASVLLPAWLLGINPDHRIAVASYGFSLAAKFNRQIQRVMDSRNYRFAFPASRLKQGGEKGYARTAEEFEVVGRNGGLIATGREGPLTGNPVDVMILDDLYKDLLEANSPIVRDNAWDWYASVVRTRLHNTSRELIVFTRWNDDDLIGRIGRKERIVALHSPDQIGEVPADHWFHLNFEAIKESVPSLLDPRPEGEPLWPERHSLRLLEEKRELDRVMFSCMYQGVPLTRDQLLYGDAFQTYTALPEEVIRKGNYTDTADTGDDFLCSVCYDVSCEGMVYVTDVVYTQETMEHTEETVAAMLNRQRTRVAMVESNNGGRGFARQVQRMARVTKVEWFHQGANKESRILTNAPTVLRHVMMPADWRGRWPDFAAHLCGYRRTFRLNRWHDAVDVLTGIVEVEVLNTRGNKGVRKVAFSK
ncbi:MAG: phage terminase large subunit [Rikenellaceae bacterium]|jgi:predicted phage terminase large subunit-like protein|nr:phage terminase large subunit [Rikenellaceae bacterium]